MALSYSSVTIDDVTSIGTSEKFISSETNPGGVISVLPNEMIVLSTSIGTHGTDDITVTVYGSLDGGTSKYEVKSFLVPAGDTDEHEIGAFIGVPDLDIGYVASGSTDNPTASTLAKKSVLNGA